MGVNPSQAKTFALSNEKKRVKIWRYKFFVVSLWS